MSLKRVKSQIIFNYNILCYFTFSLLLAESKYIVHAVSDIDHDKLIFTLLTVPGGSFILWWGVLSGKKRDSAYWRLKMPHNGMGETSGIVK